MPQDLPNRRVELAELVVRDSVEVLNAALAEANIAPADVVSILAVPRITPAIGDHEPKLRVIYRVERA